MNFFDKSIENSIKHFSSNKILGLGLKEQRLSEEKFGRNVLTKNKKRGFLSRFFSAFKEPMIIILMFGFIVAFGTNLGKFLKSNEGDFSECIGILLAVLVSVFITLIMEGGSEKAFEALNKIYDSVAVRVLRSGKVILLSQEDVLVGDIILIESGDKIIADGRLIESQDLVIDESALTGESIGTKKDANLIMPSSSPLAERKNCVFSGTFVLNGTGKMLVTAVGDKTEIGSIAIELNSNKQKDSPLSQKLARLGKTITIIGASSAILVFIISIVRLYIHGGLTFNNVQELFISCIVLIVAAVPEGLPTIIAISLALNMIKLAKSNALIKKMTATETAGAVSVICSDKTGTLTQNKMKVMAVCYNNSCHYEKMKLSEELKQNFILNSTADIINDGKKKIFKGNSSECALLSAYQESEKAKDYISIRKSYRIIDQKPFSSQLKFMMTTFIYKGTNRTLIKGAGEKILDMCDLSEIQKNTIRGEMASYQKNAKRVMCFAHLDGGNKESKFIYDGFVAIADPIRKEVYKAVSDCKKAGIKIKILTGDNKLTAYAIAKELKIANDESQVVESSEVEKLDDVAFKKMLNRISVIARSTPTIKLRVVRALKEMGEVVAVTGDGINDAPAIKHADVGIAMGISGSDISKEAADIVLLDDSFSTVVKSIAFGRNVYKNLQRFILFQLSVNLSALLFITVCAIINMPSPFNTLQLLWINVIMDGPPALTLGLEGIDNNIMNHKPVKRESGIVGLSMFIRIAFNGIFIGIIMILQYVYNFLNLEHSELASGIFTLFILFQLFNAFNSRELGKESIFKGIGRNKIMLLTFGSVFLLHFLIVQCFSKMFAINPLSMISWIKIILLASQIIAVCEIYKFIYRIFFKNKYKILQK